MSRQTLQIGKDLTLPAAAVTSTFGVLAVRGAGKSNLAVVTPGTFARCYSPSCVSSGSCSARARRSTGSARRLVTPPGALVLDPFAGSGTTGLACITEQRRFLDIEREAEYVAIATARLRDEHARFETGGPLFAETAEPADGSTMATTY